MRPIAVVLLGLAVSGVAFGKSMEEATPVLVKSIAKQLVSKQRVKVATLDFTDIQGRPNELGRFLAEQLAVDLVAADGITVIDRANISSVMAEHKLTAEGLVKPENAKKLGQFAGVDALLIGNLATLDNMFTLTVKAISTETSEVVAAGRTKFDVTQDAMKQFGTMLSGGNALANGGSTAGNSAPSSQESDTIAKKVFGSMEVVLKTVTAVHAQTDDGTSIPVITCSFELYNRDLKSSVAIAANGRNERLDSSEFDIGSYRGSLNDSAGQRWGLKDLKGLSAVLGINCISYLRSLGGDVYAQVKQNNPSAVVDYIKNGKNCELGPASQPAITAIGRYWAGSFSSIPPAKSLRVTAEFVPVDPDNRGEGAVQTPQSFQFDMELVIATVMPGESPEKVKDLRLENLTFDRIVMPAVKEKK